MYGLFFQGGELRLPQLPPLATSLHLSNDEFSENEENSDSNEDDQSDQVDLTRTFEQSSSRTRARTMPQRYHDYIA